MVEIGKIYQVAHCRKGTFNLKVSSIHAGWISGLIVKGMADAVIRENELYEGDEITVRESLCDFLEINDNKEIHSTPSDE